MKNIRSIRIRSYSGPFISAFRLNVERYRVSLRIQSECEKIRIRITPNTDTFNAANFTLLCSSFFFDTCETSNALDVLATSPFIPFPLCLLKSLFRVSPNILTNIP